MNRKVLAAGLGIALVLQGCATKPGPDGTPATTGGLDKRCYAVAAAAALTCGLIASGNDWVRAAAACSAVAFAGCYLASNYEAKQARNAAQVQEEFLKTNRQLPAHSLVTVYSTSVNPSNAIRRGQKVEIASRIVAVKGTADRELKIEEELTILDAQGRPWGQPVRKLANTNGEAGEFVSNFTLSVHDGMSQGMYTLRKRLFMNGTVARTDERSSFQIALIDEVGAPVLALLSQ